MIDEAGEVERRVLDAVMDKIKGLTRLADVYPWARADMLDGLAETWRTAGTSTKGTGTKCDEAVTFTTKTSNNEWQTAMRHFSRSLWGTSAWGKDQGGYQYGHQLSNRRATSQPVLQVLDDNGLLGRRRV